MGVEQPIRLRTLEAYVERVHGGPRGLSATEVRVLDEWAGKVVDRIAGAWPVDTSTSRDAWTHRLMTKAGDLGFVLENDTYYAEYVHLKGEPAEPALYETLIPDVVGEVKGEMLADLRAAVDDTEARYQRYKKAGEKRPLNRAMSESAPSRTARKVA